MKFPSSLNVREIAPYERYEFAGLADLYLDK